MQLGPLKYGLIQKNLTIYSPIVTKVKHGLNKCQLKTGNPNITRSKDTIEIIHNVNTYPGPSFIKPDQLDPRIKDQLRNALLSTILSLQLPNFVSCGGVGGGGLSLPHDTKFGNCRGEIVILDPWIKLILFDKSGACFAEYNI